MSVALGRGARLLVWDYVRGSLAYDLFCALILLFVLLVPATWMGDPMVLLP